jgi:hypothetical protein
VTAQISQDNQVTVDGLISSGAGQVVSVAVSDPNGNYEYVNSTLSTDGGNFSFSYPMSNDNTAGTYNVKVGGTMVAEPATASFGYNLSLLEGGGGVAGMAPTKEAAYSGYSESLIALTFAKDLNSQQDLSGFDDNFSVTFNGTTVYPTDVSIDPSDPAELDLLVDGSFSNNEAVSLTYSGTPSNPITAEDGTPLGNFTVSMTALPGLY